MLLLLLLFLPITITASEFIRSIEYTVSPDMTLNEAKANALKQLKIDILSEVGSLIESEIKSNYSNGKKIESVNFSQISVGNIKVKILHEAFDGQTLFLEINADVNNKNVIKMLSRVYSIKDKDKEVNNLLDKLSKTESDNKEIRNENKLLKIKLSSIKAGILFIEKMKVKSDSVKIKFIEIEERWAIAKDKIQARILSERESYVSIRDLSKKVYIQGMTFDEFNSIIPVVNIKKYLKDNPIDNCISTVSHVYNYYYLAKYKYSGNYYFLLLETKRLNGLISNLGRYSYNTIDWKKTRCEYNFSRQ